MSPPTSANPIHLKAACAVRSEAGGSPVDSTTLALADRRPLELHFSP